MSTHDRWRRIKDLFHAALDHSPAERPAFLTEVCGNDAAMRDEVEALLTADAENEDFLSETAFEFAEGMLAHEPREFSVGQEVGQYKIEYFLSSGGMGQIYKAHDTKLGRKIALKFISPEYARDPRRVQRFEQEARAASALNHPNVCVIHEIGVTDNDRHFIAMEFIQGSTLRDELARRRFSPREALEIIIQVADALASAHAKGIVHRDIKPENIMLRPDGYVKVVDFGLAKLTELLTDQQHASEAKTRVHTEAHMIMGTVRYMSPEQLREFPVDERTDIWSLGIVLYEMLTGATPFNARAPNDSIALILTSQPQFNKAIPIQLREIIKKTLEKDCAQRYQTITKLSADLSKLKWDLEHNEEDYIAPVPELQPAPITHISSFLTRIKSQAVVTADSLFGEIRTYKTATLFATSFAFVLLLFFLFSSAGPHESPFQNVSMEQLTDAGTSVCTAISSDGSWVAHAEEQNGKQRLTLTNSMSATTFVAVPADDVKYVGISFSPDTAFLYLTRREKNNDGILYQLQLSGLTLAKLKEGVDSPISFSPQGDRFAFVRYNEATTEFSLVLSDIDGTNEQVIARRKNGDTLSLFGVAWSPDGRTVICPAGDWKKSWQMNLVAFDLEKGRERVIGNQSWFSMQQIAWYPDMTGLVVSATLRQTAPHQLWWISFPDGTVQKITRDLSEYSSIGLGGKKLVAVQANRQWRIWVVPLDNVEKATPITSGVGLYYGLNWTSKGKIVYSAMAQERLNLFQIDPNGGPQGSPLTANAGDNFMPASSPDGRFILFVSNRDGSYNIWRMNADDGSEPTQLTFGDGNFYPSVSPDNQWAAYDNLVKSSTSIFKVPLAGGEPVKVGEKYRMPVFSPDNQFIAARFDEVSGSRDVAIFPAQGGEPLRRFNIPVQDWQSVQWLPNGREVSYVKNVGGYSNIWTYDLDTGAEKQITRFNTDQIYAYAWSPDYKQIACLRGNKFPNVAIMR